MTLVSIIVLFDSQIKIFFLFPILFFCVFFIYHGDVHSQNDNNCITVQIPLKKMLVLLLVEWVMLTSLDMLLSCPRMLLRSLLTCSPNSSATNRRLYRFCRSGSTREPADSGQKTQTSDEDLVLSVLN